MYLRYEYDPNDPNGKEDAKIRALASYFLGLFSLGSIIYFIYALVELCKGNDFLNIFFSFGSITIMAILDFFFIFASADKEVKKELASKYFLFFFGGVLDFSALIAMIVSISSLGHYGTGALMLICSVFLAIVVTISVILIYRKIEGYESISIKLFSDKDDLKKTKLLLDSNYDTEAYFFCHKCGKKLPTDSAFCSSCGSSLEFD